MSNFLNLSSRVVMGAAIVGIVGAAGVYIYEQIYAERRRAMLVTEVARLDRQVCSMRTELETLRELQKEMQLRRLKHRRNERAKREKRAAHVGDAPDAPNAPDSLDAPDVVEKDLSYASDSEYFTDYQSILGTDADLDSEEFYDVHSDDEDDYTLQESVVNGLVIDPPSEDVPQNADLKSPRKNST